MIRTLFLISCLIAVFNNIDAQHSKAKPKVIIGIVVDQMRADYLARYYHKYSEGGFKKILHQGFQFKNAHYNYKSTSTGPGHASVYTGTTPSRHGIISNSWYKRDSAKIVNCVSDLNVKPVGGSGSKGFVSSHRLASTTITDELRLTSNHRSKVVGISFKDRGAALPAGHNPTGAFWYDRSNGEFVSSIADQLLEIPFVHEAITATNLAKRNISDPYVQLLQNAYHTKRSADVLIMHESGFLRGNVGDRGTSHGTAHTYDSHIPILFYGTAIPNGTSVRKVAITDIAPTISMLLDISLPSSATGHPLIELFDE